MQPSRLLERISSGALSNVDMRDLQRLVEALGFTLVQVRGSHHIYAHPNRPGVLNLQARKGEAKPYQIRQLLDMIDKHGLCLDRKK